MLTCEFFALILVIWAYLREQDNRTDKEWKPDADGSNFGSPVLWYKYNPKKRALNHRIALLALALSLAGILLWIWTPLP